MEVSCCSWFKRLRLSFPVLCLTAKYEFLLLLRCGIDKQILLRPLDDAT